MQTQTCGYGVNLSPEDEAIPCSAISYGFEK